MEPKARTKIFLTRFGLPGILPLSWKYDIRNPTPPIGAYLGVLEEHSCQVSSRSDLKLQSRRLLLKMSTNKNKKKKWWVAIWMGSIPDQKIINNITHRNSFRQTNLHNHFLRYRSISVRCSGLSQDTGYSWRGTLYSHSENSLFNEIHSKGHKCL